MPAAESSPSVFSSTASAVVVESAATVDLDVIQERAARWQGAEAVRLFGPPSVSLETMQIVRGLPPLGL